MGEYYSGDKLLTYGKLFNMILGARNIGKTFWFKRRFLKRFVKHGEPFIYLRRHNEELKKLDKENFFKKDLLEMVFDNYQETNIESSQSSHVIEFTSTTKGFEKGKIVISSNKVTINKKIAVYMKALTKWVDLKGSEYDEINNILFDEVLIDMNAPYKHYIKNEVEGLFQLMWSIFRRRTNVHIYLLSNATNYNNPYFAYFNFDGDTSKEYYAFNHYDAVIQFPKTKIYTEEEIANNPMLKLTRSSKVYESNVNNTFQQGDFNHVGKLSGNKEYLFSIDGMGVYSAKEGLLISDKHEDNRNFVTESRFLEDGTTLLDRNSPPRRLIRNAYYENQLYYKNVLTKSRFHNVLLYCL